MTDLFRRKLLQGGGAILALGAVGRSAFAQTPWPSTTKLVVPFQAGGGADNSVRMMEGMLGKALGTTIVVENKPGASGLIAAKSVINAPPDGSVILLMSNLMVTQQAITGRYDLLKDLKPVTKTTVTPHVLVVRGNSPYKTQADLIAAIQSAPGKLSYASGGIGSNTHLMYEILSDRVPGGLKALHVPFKSGAEGAVALLSGEVDFSFQHPGAVLAYLKKGTLRALSITANKRPAQFPDVPTVAQAGVPGYNYVPWGGYALPGKARPELVERLFTAVKAVASKPEYVAYLGSVGASVEISESAAAFAEQLRTEIQTEQALVKRLGLKT